MRRCPVGCLPGWLDNPRLLGGLPASCLLSGFPVRFPGASLSSWVLAWLARQSSAPRWIACFHAVVVVVVVVVVAVVIRRCCCCCCCCCRFLVFVFVFLAIFFAVLAIDSVLVFCFSACRRFFLPLAPLSPALSCVYLFSCTRGHGLAGRRRLNSWFCCVQIHFCASRFAAFHQRHISTYIYRTNHEKCSIFSDASPS